MSQGAGPLRFIHYQGIPPGTCERADKLEDVRHALEGDGARILWTAVATHPENVDCPTCRAWLKRAGPL